MSETYPRKTLCETLFAGHTPSSVDSTAKLHKINNICKFYMEFPYQGLRKGSARVV